MVDGKKQAVRSGYVLRTGVGSDGSEPSDRSDSGPTPEIGFWVGPHLLVWGMSPATPDRNELAGRYFTFVSVAMAFLFASGTTLALRWLTQSKLWQQSVLRRMTR